MYASLLVFLGVVRSVALAFKYSGVSSSLKRSSNAIIKLAPVPTVEGFTTVQSYCHAKFNRDFATLSFDQQLEVNKQYLQQKPQDAAAVDCTSKGETKAVAPTPTKKAAVSTKTGIKHILPQLKSLRATELMKLKDEIDKLILGQAMVLNNVPKTLKGKLFLDAATYKGPPAVDCTSLKTALLTAKVEGGFLCLSGSEVFPVSMKETTNKAPSKLLMRPFHNEMKLIVKKLRHNRQLAGKNGGAVFFGPSGTGKTWAGGALLVDELREAEVSGKTVVYFSSGGKKAFVFSKERSVMYECIASPNEIDIPELMVRDTVLIYDTVMGEQEALSIFPCEYLIFSSPNAGNYKNVAGNNGLVRFVCPSWTLEELKLLEHGYGDRVTPEEVESLFERFGGSPRAVVANEESISETQQENEARLLLKGVVPLWSDLATMNAWSSRSSLSVDWPSRLLKARYDTEETAVTPEEAFNKYLEKNVNWEYCNTGAMELVHAKYEKADEATKRTYQSWLEREPKAAAMYGNWFEFHGRLSSAK